MTLLPERVMSNDNYPGKQNPPLMPGTATNNQNVQSTYVPAKPANDNNNQTNVTPFRGK